MKTTTLTPEENARDDGREAATEGGANGEPLAEWRTRCRAKIMSDFDSGKATAISAEGASNEDFLQLLAQWDSGFEEGMCGLDSDTPPDASELERRAAWQDGYSVGFETALQVLESRSVVADDSQSLAVQRIGREALTLAELLTAASRFPASPRRVLVATAGLADCIAEELNRIAGGSQ